MKPLEKLVVLDLTRVLAGPYSAMMMGDFGAEIIKIEQPEVGDDSRAYGPFIGKESAYFMSLNRNKKSMTLNFKEPAAKELFKKNGSESRHSIGKLSPWNDGRLRSWL